MAAGLRPGDLVALTYPTAGIDDVRSRILGVEVPGPEAPHVLLTVRKDSAHLMVNDYPVPADTPLTPFLYAPEPCHDVLVFELPLAWTGKTAAGLLVVPSPTLTNAALVAALGAETGFTVRACLIQCCFTTEHTKVAKELRRDRLGLPFRPLRGLRELRGGDLETGSTPLTADNFTLLAEDTAKRVATYQNGTPFLTIQKAMDAASDLVSPHFTQEMRAAVCVCRTQSPAPLL